MRNIHDVIEEMISWCNDDSLTEKLRHIQRSSGFKPPEQKIEIWQLLSQALLDSFGPILPKKATWQYMVLKALNPDVDKFY